MGEIGKDYDDIRYWQEAIRTNNIKGEFNMPVLTKRVIELYEKTRKMYDADELKRKLGFSGKNSAFEKIINNVEKSLPPELRKRFREASKEIGSVEDLSRVLNELFKQYGKTLNSNFMVFVWGGKECLMVRCDTELWKLVKIFTERLENSGKDARDEFKEIFRKELYGEEV
jgi:hypothetical protein